MSAPEWLVAGARAAIYNGGRGKIDQVKVTLVTVEKIGKRDVVLSNRDRYHLPRLSKDVGGAWGTTNYLVPADDARVVQALAYGARLRARRAAEAALKEWSDTGDDAHARAAISVIEAAL